MMIQRFLKKSTTMIIMIAMLASLLTLSVYAVPAPPDTTLGVERINATTLRLTAANAEQYQFDVREMGQQDYATIRPYDEEAVFDWTDAEDGKLYEMVAHGISIDGYAGYYVVFGNTASEGIDPFLGVDMEVGTVGNAIQITAIPDGGTNVIYALQHRLIGGEYNLLDPSNPYQATTTFMLDVTPGDYELVVHAIDTAAGNMVYFGSYTPFTHAPMIIVSNENLYGPQGDYGIDLSDRAGSDQVEGIEFTVNAPASTLTITGIEGGNGIEILYSKVIQFTGSNADVPINDLLPDGFAETSISVSRLRDLFGEGVTVKGTLKSTGYIERTTPIAITLLSDK